MMTKKLDRVPLGASQLRKDASNNEGLTTQDPIQTTAMKVSVFDIEPYDKNPRRKENPEYIPIKESIRQKGLEQIFKITRKPGDPKYTIMKGGNTRLTALQELHTETKDERYLIIDTLFEPWVSESDALLSHLVENDLRGHLCFIERAFAIQNLKQDIETERGLKLSSRELEAVLKESGYTVGRTILALMNYTLDKLYPVMPKPLDEGMGKPQIEKIRKFEGQANLLWQYQAFEANQFTSVFQKALTELNLEEKFEIDNLRVHFENFTADETGIAISTIRFIMETAINSPNRLKEEIDHATFSLEHENESETLYTDTQSNTPDMSLPFTEDLDNEPSEDELSEEMDEELFTDPEPSKELSQKLAEELTQESNQSPLPEANQSDTESTSEPDTLASLRANNLELAKDIAKASHPGYEKIVKKINDGYGFIMFDVPKDSYLLNGWGLEDVAFRKSVCIWFQLYSMSGATTPGMREKILTHFFHENDVTIFLEANHTDYREYVSKYLSLAVFIDNFFWNDSELIDDEIIDKAIQLIHGIRKINRLAKTIMKPVWEGGEFDEQ